MGREEVMPPEVAGDESRRQLLDQLVDRFGLLRGNWEVDYPEMVEKVLAMAAGREPLCGRYVAIAGDPTYTFIELTESEHGALELLANWASDEHYPKCPLALADLAGGSVHAVQVTVSRGALYPDPMQEVTR